MIDVRLVADVLLAAAVRSVADTVFIEPFGDRDYVVIFERDRVALTTVALDGRVGAATVARLAFLGELDLTAPHTTSAVVPIRSGDREGDVLISLRPGSLLRAELMVLRERRAPVRLPPPSPPLAPGDRVGNYRITTRLGEGGMGTVFRVQHVVLEREYALKIVRASVFEGDAFAADRFLREARAASRVRHPNIVDVYDCSHMPDGRPYFVMELIDGESLATHAGGRSLAPADALVIARQLASALAAVHDRGVIHADVTPSNVMVLRTSPLKVKLADFGLASTDETVEPPSGDFVLGTPQYISPEQLHGVPATDRSDQYALGAVLFQLLAGHPPYQHAVVRELCMMHLHAPIPVVESPYGPLPPKLVDLVATCLQKAPQARFPGMRAMLAALQDVEPTIARTDWRRWLSV